MSKTAAIKERVEDDLRKYAILAGYLLIAFCVMAFYEATWTNGEHIATRLSSAAIKALIFAKFLLITQNMGVVGTVRMPHLVGGIIAKSVQYVLILGLLTIAEEVVVGWVHHKPLAATLAEIEGPTAMQMVAKSLLGLIILLPLIATQEISRELGPGVLRDKLFGSGGKGD